jgi:pimeloyl-ACP methyl ester carboxylesterase
MTTSQSTSSPAFLSRPGGRVAYDVAGEGPLVVCIPGMGDLRQTYRHLAPALVLAGYRVATFDLRGQGDSDTTFDAYDVAAAASDARALIAELGGDPAVVVGSSMGSSAAALLAAENPELVSGLVLTGPFLRDGAAPRWKQVAFRLALARPWRLAAWRAWLPKLYAGSTPADHAAYVARVVEALRRPGALAAFGRTTRSSHAGTEARLGDVRAPALVVMGRLDPDFPDPVAEAEWAAAAVRGSALVVDEAGHYPASQRPDVVVPAVLDFLRETARRA